MKTKCRAVYEELYSFFRHDPVNSFICFYCGEPAETMDHQPPISRVSDYRSMGLKHERFIKVAACKECNMFAGDTLTETVIERERFIKDRILRKYKRIYYSPEWTKTQIRQAEIKGTLKRYIKDCANRQTWLSDRLDYSVGVNAYIDKFDDAEIYQNIVGSSKN